MSAPYTMWGSDQDNQIVTITTKGVPLYVMPLSSAINNAVVAAELQARGAVAKAIEADKLLLQAKDKRGQFGLTLAAAKRNAAEMVGVPPEAFIKLYNGVIPRGMAVKGEVS